MPLLISRRTFGSAEQNSRCATPTIREHQHVDMPRDSFFQWQVHDKQTRTSSNLLLYQQRGQNLLDQWCQSTVSLRIASLAATGINDLERK